MVFSFSQMDPTNKLLFTLLKKKKRHRENCPFTVPRKIFRRISSIFWRPVYSFMKMNIFFAIRYDHIVKNISAG